MGFNKSKFCMTVKSSNDLDQTLYTDYPEFEFEYANKREPTTLPPGKQKLIVGLDRKKLNVRKRAYVYLRSKGYQVQFAEN